MECEQSRVRGKRDDGQKNVLEEKGKRRGGQINSGKKGV